MVANPMNQIRVAYDAYKHLLDSGSKTAFNHYFVTITGFESAYNNLPVLNAFISMQYQVLSADNTKTMSSNALFAVYEAIVDMVPDSNVGVPSSFYAATRQTDPASGNAIWVLGSSPLATGAIGNYGHDVAENACFTWAFTYGDHAGSSSANGPITQYVDNTDAALACLGALYTPLA